MKFIVEVNDYEAGSETPLSTSSIEDAVKNILDANGDDGIVIVQESEEK